MWPALRSSDRASRTPFALGSRVGTAPLPHADFIHLRVHSAYSLSAGAIKVKQLVGLCKQQQMPAVAITDTGNLFGALEFAQAAIEAGVQPIIGCELALRRCESDGTGGEGRVVRPTNGTAAAAQPDRIVLLAQNETGYRHLARLVSKSYLEESVGEAPQVSLADLAGHGEGLLCLTGGPCGPVGRLIGEGQDGAAETVLLQLAAIY